MMLTMSSILSITIHNVHDFLANDMDRECTASSCVKGGCNRWILQTNTLSESNSMRNTTKHTQTSTTMMVIDWNRNTTDIFSLSIMFNVKYSEISGHCIYAIDIQKCSIRSACAMDFLGCDLWRCNFDAVCDSLDGDGSGGTGNCSSWWADCEFECVMTFRWWECPCDVGLDDDRCNRFGDWECAAVAAGATADVLWVADRWILVGVGGLTGCSAVLVWSFYVSGRISAVVWICPVVAVLVCGDDWFGPMDWVHR